MDSPGVPEADGGVCSAEHGAEIPVLSGAIIRCIKKAETAKRKLILCSLPKRERRRSKRDTNGKADRIGESDNLYAFTVRYAEQEYRYRMCC
jgi:hypothetical protein